MIERRPFGATGHRSSRVLFGAAGLGSLSPDRATAVLERALRNGVNHIDTAAGYGDSEEKLRPFLSLHRGDVFLATKTGERSASGARADLERSLTRMGVDSIDLVQLHNLVEPDDWQTALGPGGALGALQAAREEGLVRFIGVTGHGLRIPAMHLRSLERFPFDSVLAPLNAPLMADETYARDMRRLIEVCAERDVAVQTIKSVARRRWLDDDRHPHFSWYEPLPAGPALTRAVSYVLSWPTVFLNSSSDVRLLEPILDAAAHHRTAPDPAALAADAAEWGMTPLFDGAALERI